MSARRCRSAAVIVAFLGLASSPTIALAQSRDAARTLAKNDGLLIDGKTFDITRATGKGDASALIARLGAREIAAGAIIYRKDGKLYIADNVAVPPAAVVTTDPPAVATADPAAERRRAQGIRDPNADCGQPAAVRDPSGDCRLAAPLRDPASARQQPQGLHDTDAARQQPQGLHDTDAARQQPQGLQDPVAARQQPLGAPDLDAGRQQSQHLRDLAGASQQSQGPRTVEVTPQQRIESNNAAAARQRVYINDPDYVYYHLKKAFEETWSTADKK